MPMIKRSILFVATSVLALSLGGCGSKPSTPDAAKAVVEASSTSTPSPWSSDPVVEPTAAPTISASASTAAKTNPWAKATAPAASEAAK